MSQTKFSVSFDYVESWRVLDVVRFAGTLSRSPVRSFVSKGQINYSLMGKGSFSLDHHFRTWKIVDRMDCKEIVSNP